MDTADAIRKQGDREGGTEGGMGERRGREGEKLCLYLVP